MNKREHQINEEIRDAQIRLVGSEGEQLGIMSGKEAIELAYSKEMDLVKIAPQAAPPVCKIMDYGKYCYDLVKREKESKKKQKITSVKEVQLSLKIDTHDFETKLRNANRFLTAGDKVKVVLRFKGREIVYAQLGNELMERFRLGCEETGTVDKPAKLDGRNIIMIISPKQAKPEK